MLPAQLADLYCSQAVGVQPVLSPSSHRHPCRCAKTSHHGDENRSPEVISNRRWGCFLSLGKRSPASGGGGTISRAAPGLVSRGWEHTQGSCPHWSGVVSAQPLIAGGAQSHSKCMVL